VKDPSNAKTITSSTSRLPSRATWIVTSAAGRANDFAEASPASASARERRPLERDAWRLPACVLDLEEVLLRESERAGEEHAGTVWIAVL
jgi:hypothetical protein